MVLRGCFWGPYAFLVGSYQEGPNPAHSDLSPSLHNLNRVTSPHPSPLLGPDLGSWPQSVMTGVATEHPETTAPCRSLCPGWRRHETPPGRPG